jgi:hypothetical protein
LKWIKGKVVINLNEIYQHQLKTGEIVKFKTDMINEEVKKLPIFANQHKFFKYFRDKGNQLEIYQIVKQPLNHNDK